jgi:hypothetical protein
MGSIADFVSILAYLIFSLSLVFVTELYLEGFKKFWKGHAIHIFFF